MEGVNLSVELDRLRSELAGLRTDVQQEAERADELDRSLRQLQEMLRARQTTLSGIVSGAPEGTEPTPPTV
jgi:hypothetical protein